jgi:NAD(P)H dehydrogenase (quinone)
MNPRRILVVIGHPVPESLGHQLARSYAEAAEAAGGEVRIRDLAEAQPASPSSRELLRVVDGDLSLLEPAVSEDIADLLWAEHLVIVFPQWWGTYPAVLKAWIDRTFLSGIAFRYGAGMRWEKLLSGRSARLVMTADTPGFYNRLVYRDAAITALRAATLGYCGIKTIGVSRFDPVKGSTLERRHQWIARMARLGETDGQIAGQDLSAGEPASVATA